MAAEKPGLLQPVNWAITRRAGARQTSPPADSVLIGMKKAGKEEENQGFRPSCFPDWDTALPPLLHLAAQPACDHVAHLRQRTHRGGERA
jgi:hypothetical protein